jgi:hypothetical protein
MADNTTVEVTIASAALSTPKGPLKSFFDFFGGKSFRLNKETELDEGKAEVQSQIVTADGR